MKHSIVRAEKPVEDIEELTQAFIDDHLRPRGEMPAELCAQTKCVSPAAARFVCRDDCVVRELAGGDSGLKPTPPADRRRGTAGAPG